MSNLYQTFFNHLIVFTSLHAPYYFTLPYSVSLWSNIRKHLLFSGSSRAEIFLWQKQLIPAPFYLKSISLLLISATLLYLWTILSYMSAVGEEHSEPETSYCLLKTFLLLLIKSPNARNLFLPLLYVFLSLFSFSLSGLLRPLPQICRVWLTETPQKVPNKSP